MGTAVASALINTWTETSPARLADELASQLEKMEPRLVCAFASPKWPLAKVTEALTKRFPKACIIAASSAGEFAGAKEGTQAACAWAVAGDYIVRAGIGHGLTSGTEKAVREAIAEQANPIGGYDYRTAIVLLDPLTGKGEEAALLAAGMLGPDVPIVGGAAGDDLNMVSTEVALGTEIAKDALVVATIHSKTPLGLGVKHGHRALSGNLTVTRAEGATVYEVEGKPAWEVWMEHTAQRAAELGIDVKNLRDEEIGGFLLRFEAGLPVGENLKVRAPLARGEDGSLSFACGIPQGATFRITESEPELQIQSAKEAAQIARRQLAGKAVAGGLIFDCICRKLILADEFALALQAICSELGTDRIAGFETYGEIALAPGDMSGFHNTTTVVLAFPS